MLQFSRVFFAAALIALVLTPGFAQAVDQPREHDGGIFIRLSAGIGSANAKLEFDTGDELEIAEAGGNHNFAIGGIVGRNFAIHATAFGWALSDPAVDLNGNEVGNLDGTASLNALGGGVTWYFGSNWYLSGSLAFAWLDFKDHNVSVDSGVGGAIDLTLAKEWWVSDRWGLGVALGLQGFGVPADDANTFNGGSASLRFSATFN